MGLTRRDFLKTSIAGATAATVGMPLSEQAEAAVKAGEKGWQWDKGSAVSAAPVAASWWPPRMAVSSPPRAIRMHR
jgi:anaerobic selenocysteine-containing dehydrogenase